jgi:uncharacterized lipoprotein
MFDKKKVAASWAVLSLALGLSACSMFKSNDTQGIYQHDTKGTQPLVIPQHLSTEKLENQYPLPQIDKSAPAPMVSVIPPGSSLEAAAATPTKTTKTK